MPPKYFPETKTDSLICNQRNSS